MAEALKAHIASVRTHLKGLSAKEYTSFTMRSLPDFVVMFIPIEPAFMLAIAEDSPSLGRRLESNVLLVSSSTLLFVMRIVMQLWRQDKQSRSAREIARRGSGAL